MKGYKGKDVWNTSKFVLIQSDNKCFSGGDQSKFASRRIYIWLLPQSQFHTELLDTGITSLNVREFKSRKHSSRMPTTCLPTVRASATRCQYWWDRHQVDKFGQVSSDGHQMSLAGGWGWGQRVPCLMSMVGWDPCVMSRGLGLGGFHTWCPGARAGVREWGTVQ